MKSKWVKGFNRGRLDKVLVAKTNGRTCSYGYKVDKFKFRKEMAENGSQVG